ncbi:MAG: cbb3-type cytochrome c oxidase subunit I [Chlamydiota bacterium]
MIGRLSIEALKHDWIEYMAGVSIVGGALFAVALISYFRLWTTLWKDWITSVDHKKIGIMYIVVAFLMLVKGLIDAMMMRAQQAMAVGDSMGYLEADHYQQIFTAHGSSMIFFVAMGAVFGIINLLLPLQIGARDVAFPFLNNLSFWLFSSGALLIIVSLVIGVFSGAGWSCYPPLATMRYNPGVGVDYWLWSVQISGIGSLLSGINFLVTILKMRCPGMHLMRMPIFVWSVFATVVLVFVSFPILTANLGLLFTDRMFATRFFDTAYGGNPMVYINLFWAWGHPEVYILILPTFGMFSEIVPVFSQKNLFGYTSMVWAIVAILFLSFLVWLHHFFTMGAGPKVNAFFGIMTMVIAIPTGVKIFNWLFTMFRGKILFASPMYWFLGFVFLFTIGGVAGVMLSIPGIDFQLHNSLFLVAHFHSVIIGGVLFGFFAAFTFWFPKFAGFRLDERIGKYAFWCWFIGFLLSFMPLYLLGFMGATRRLNHYTVADWQPLFLIAFAGVMVVLLGVGLQFLQIFVSILRKDRYRDTTGDPWNGRNLEWSIKSPPPVFNFSHIPEVEGRDAFWHSKVQGKAQKGGPYHPITMPSNTPYGFLLGFFSFVFAFAMVWYIFWLAILSILGGVVCAILRLYEKETEYTISQEDVERMV